MATAWPRRKAQVAAAQPAVVALPLAPGAGAVARSAQSGASASAPGADGIGLLHVLQTATKTTGPVPYEDGGDSRAPDSRKRPAVNHWNSGYTPEPATAPATATHALPGAGAAPAVVAAAGDDDAGDAMEDDAGAVAAAPVPAPAYRPIVINKHTKAKGAPPPTFEEVRNAAGVGGTPLPSCPPTRLAPSSLMIAPQTSPLAYSSRASAGPPTPPRSMPCAPTSDR
jgi:hypothetical protein